MSTLFYNRVFNDTENDWFLSIFSSSTKSEAIENQYRFFVHAVGLVERGAPAGQVSLHGLVRGAHEVAQTAPVGDDHLRRLEHRAQGSRYQELEAEPEELGVPA